MHATSRATWVLAAMLAASPAFADDDVRTASLSRAPDSASKAGPAEDRAASSQRHAGNEAGVDTAGARAESAGKLADSRGGLHWANDGQRPVLQYQFSDTAVMRIRGAGGGGAVSFNWKF